jgi:hypothetical protein
MNGDFEDITKDGELVGIMGQIPVKNEGKS